MTARCAGFVPTKKEILDDSVITPAAAHGFVNEFFFGHLWHVVMWLCNSRRIMSCRQVVPHGVGGMKPFKAPEKRAGMTKSHVLRTPMVDSSRFFAEALPFGLS